MPIYRKLKSTLKTTAGLGGHKAKLITMANQARAGRNYREAADFYASYLETHPDDGRIHVQCGHMNKESGRLDLAETHYLAALELMPADADLALQLGHFYKVSGRLTDAEAAYARPSILLPTENEAASELAGIRRLITVSDDQGIVSINTKKIYEFRRTEAKEFVKNAKAENFKERVNEVIKNKNYVLLEGLDQRITDPALDESSILAGLVACIKSGDGNLFLRSCRALLNAKRIEKIPLQMLVDALEGFAESDTGLALSQARTIPVEAQNAMYNVAIAALKRQGAVIQQLLSLAEQRSNRS